MLTGADAENTAGQKKASSSACQSHRLLLTNNLPPDCARNDENWTLLIWKS